MSGNNVRVVCRFRPQNEKELTGGGTVIYRILDEASVELDGAEYGKHVFNFDRIFGGDSTQKLVYDYAAKPVIEDIMKGYNGTIFVYGQTSSGKTHTMQGPNIEDQELRGIIPRMNGTIFETVANADPNTEFLVKASYIEIYKEKIRDLLDGAKTNLQVREEKTKGIWVEGATEVYVSSEQDVLDVIRTGSQNRAIAETKMNSESSRSHSIFILSVNQKNLTDGSNKTGKLYLVDLAGSEKVEKTGAQGNTLDEAKMINKSLSALGNVINALTDGKSTHVPYRDSKLTRVLQESLGGNSRTTLIVNCSPSSYNEAETLSTLRFGTRAKSIKNSAKINQERSVSELKIALAKAEKEIATLQQSILALEEELQIIKNGGVVINTNNNTNNTSLNNQGVVNTANLPNVHKLQERVTELEEQVRKLEEERNSLSELQESIQDELKDKESQLLQVDQIKEELNSYKQLELTLSKENELLIVKLADITIANEKLQYDNNEFQLNIENLSAQNQSLNTEIDSLKKKVDTMTSDRNKPSKIINFQEDEKDENSNLFEQIEISKSNNSNLKVTSEEKVTLDKITKDEISRLTSQILQQNQIIESLKREKELLEISHLEKTESKQLTNVDNITNNISTTNNSNNSDVGVLEKELQLLRDQTNVKLSEFDAVKAALLKDLENRCQKVIELEILLDEAREQYQTLLLQVKNSNSKSLQQKCLFLQRNLEQLTTVQQQLVNENNRVKLENQVYVKQLAIRNERIHGLELLLQDAQEKLQKHANTNSQSETSDQNKRKTPTRPATKQSGKVALNLVSSGGRIAKPLRGGGGTTSTTNNNTINTNNLPTTTPIQQIPTSPNNNNNSGSGNINNLNISPISSPNNNSEEISEVKKSSSIWDLFRGNKQKSTTNLQSEDNVNIPNSTSNE